MEQVERRLSCSSFFFPRQTFLGSALLHVCFTLCLCFGVNWTWGNKLCVDDVDLCVEVLYVLERPQDRVHLDAFGEMLRNDG